ncbi:MAG: hypothetical protein HYT83_01965 [Candidatus Levybacteria bacterium]|nr:hypothetical protein [Candidatus Levybacteria bacterium]
MADIEAYRQGRIDQKVQPDPRVFTPTGDVFHVGEVALFVLRQPEGSSYCGEACLSMLGWPIGTLPISADGLSSDQVTALTGAELEFPPDTYDSQVPYLVAGKKRQRGKNGDPVTHWFIRVGEEVADPLSGRTEPAEDYLSREIEEVLVVMQVQFRDGLKMAHC